MITKQEYLEILLGLPTATIERSAANPTIYMTRVHVLLHYVALRRRGVTT
jgi:hypothetical protein